MLRISRPAMYMQIAHVVAQRATCMRGSNGAILVRGGNIVSYGYNGPPPGEPHCTGNDCPGRTGGCVRSWHAEANAIARAGASRGGELYSTSSPCPACAAAILNAGLTRVFYGQLYRINDHLVDMLKHLELFQVTPSGYILDFRTGEVVDIQ